MGGGAANIKEEESDDEVGNEERRDSMKQLKNIAHTFDVELGGVGVTVRKGTKWYDMPLNTELELRVCPKGHDGECNSLCEKAGEARIIGRWKGSLMNLPHALLSIEHNRDARDMEALKQMLKTGYGSINKHDPVTALIYERTK